MHFTSSFSQTLNPPSSFSSSSGGRYTDFAHSQGLYPLLRPLYCDRDVKPFPFLPPPLPPRWQFY